MDGQAERRVVLKASGGLYWSLSGSRMQNARREEEVWHLTGRSSEEVRDALARAHGSVKLALLLLQGCDPGEAAEALDRAGGQLRVAKALVESRAARKKRA